MEKGDVVTVVAISGEYVGKLVSMEDAMVESLSLHIKRRLGTRNVVHTNAVLAPKMSYTLYKCRMHFF